MEKIALLPGGFKPPHAGHYNMAKWLAVNTDADTVIVKVGAKEREGITREMSLKLWDLYRTTDSDPASNKLSIIPSKHNSPVKDVYDFIENDAPEGSTIYLAMGEKELKTNDQRFANINKVSEPKNINFETKLVPPQAGGVSGTDMREFIKSKDEYSFYEFIPDHLTKEQKEQAWQIVTTVETSEWEPGAPVSFEMWTSDWNLKGFGKEYDSNFKNREDAVAYYKPDKAEDWAFKSYAYVAKKIPGFGGDLEEDLYDPNNPYLDFMRSSEFKAGMPDGPKDDIPRSGDRIHNRQTNPHSHMSEQMATMNNQEKANHDKKLKRWKKDLKNFNKQNKYHKSPSYLKGTHSIKIHEEENYQNLTTPETITTSSALINNKIISLEVMNTPEKQIEGMMGRSELKGGLIFPLSVIQRRDFHMENCKIPLDIIFLKNSNISKIYHECPPCQESPCQNYSSMADDVIELPGGYCNKHNIQEGDEVILNLIENINVKSLLSELEDHEIKFFAMHADILKQLNTPNFKSRFIELQQELEGERLEALEYFWDEFFSNLEDSCDIEKSFDKKVRETKYGAHDAISQYKQKIQSDYGHIQYRTLQLKVAQNQDEEVNNWLITKGYINETNVFTKDWWLNIINESLLTEGGAAGHMAHPFNLPNVNSGKDLKDLFVKASDSLQSNPGAVKIDGVNSSIRLVDLDGRKQFVMDRGSKKPLDIKGITKSDLEDRFKPGHGMVKVGGEVLDMFNEALPSLESDLKKLGAWDDPNILFNMEYVSGKTNVQDYGSNFIAIHGLNKIESKEVQGKRGPLIKRASTEISYDKAALQSMLDNLKPVANKNDFEVYGSVPTEMSKKPNFNSALSKTYTVKFNEEDQTKSLDNWLKELTDIPEKDFIFIDVSGTKKKVGAVSKQVYQAILNGGNVDELFGEDKDKAIEGFTTYLATEKLGDEILKVLDSPMGTVDNHEGVVIRDNKIANMPFKITGKFILGGMVSDF